MCESRKNTLPYPFGSRRVRYLLGVHVAGVFFLLTYLLSVTPSCSRKKITIEKRQTRPRHARAMSEGLDGRVWGHWRCVRRGSFCVPAKYVRDAGRERIHGDRNTPKQAYELRNYSPPPPPSACARRTGSAAGTAPRSVCTRVHPGRWSGLS